MPWTHLTCSILFEQALSRLHTIKRGRPVRATALVTGLFVSDDRAGAPRIAPPVPAHGCAAPAGGDRFHVSADRRGVSIAATASPASDTSTLSRPPDASP